MKQLDKVADKLYLMAGTSTCLQNHFTLNVNLLVSFSKNFLKMTYLMATIRKTMYLSILIAMTVTLLWFLPYVTDV